MLRSVKESVHRMVGVMILAVRASLRTKTVASLLALLAACVGVLPRVVKGDGTPAGELTILLTYTLGFVFGILCLATLWASCALFAAEIDSERMSLSAVKPVRAVEFWVGKWLALLALQAAVLLVVYAGVYAQVVWRMHRSGWEDADRPVSRRVTQPVLPTPREEARQTFELMRQNDRVPKGMSERAVLRTLEAKAQEKYDVINPGEQVRWAFRLTRPIQAGEPVTVRVTFDTEYSTRGHVKGVCRLSCRERPGKTVDVWLDDFTQNVLEFVVDTRAFAPAGVDRVSARDGAGGDRLREFELTFAHIGDPQQSSALMVRFRQDVVLLTPGGTFEANLVRAACVHWGVLALLAAFGLMLSACFSLPVAVFVATVLLVLTMVGNAVVEVVSDEDATLWQNRVGIWVSRGVHGVSSHALQAEPLTALTHGERIEVGLLGASLAWNVVLLPMLFAGAGCVVLRRRELADAK
ncbi:MAG: hypothetical protein WCK89_04840 [bacterium]